LARWNNARFGQAKCLGGSRGCLRTCQPLHGLQPMLWGEMGAATRHGNGPVTHQFLHGSAVRANHRQTAGNDGPQAVSGEVLHARPAHRVLNPVARILDCRVLSAAPRASRCSVPRKMRLTA